MLVVLADEYASVVAVVVGGVDVGVAVVEAEVVAEKIDLESNQEQRGEKQVHFEEK